MRKLSASEYQRLKQQVLAKNPTDRKKQSLFLSDAIYRRFKEICEPTSVSAEIEEWMKEVTMLNEGIKKR